MKAPILKDKVKHTSFFKSELKQKCIKSLKHNRKLRLIWWSRHKLSSLPTRKFNNRCIVTGRGNAINRDFKLSRLEFSRWAKYKILPGVEKASW